MKQTPLLFKPEMVKQIIAGTKTQTRRIIKDEALKCLEAGFMEEYVALPENKLCPYGYGGLIENSGDLIWIRETWAKDYGGLGAHFFKADFSAAAKELMPEPKWKSPLHLKKQDARLWLQIESIKAERLNDITDDDAIAEGIEQIDFNHGGMKWYRLYQNTPKDDDATTSPVKAFRSLWEHINGPGSWELNPWVWVIKFKQVSKPEL